MFASYLVDVARILLGLLLAIAGLAKIFSMGGLKRALAQFGLPGPVVLITAPLIPVAELLTGILLLSARTAQGAAWAAVALLAIFTAGLVSALIRGKRPDCNCFGALTSAPIGWRSVIRNLLMIAAALSIAMYWRLLTAATPTSPELVVLLSGGVIVFSTQAWLLIQLFKQNGRVLARLDALEAGVADDAVNQLGVIQLPGRVRSDSSAAPFTWEGSQSDSMLHRQDKGGSQS